MDPMQDVVYLPSGYPLYPDLATREIVGTLHAEDVAFLIFTGHNMGLEPVKITDRPLITRVIQALQNSYTAEPVFMERRDILKIFVKTPDKPRRIGSFAFEAGYEGDFGPEFQAIMQELGWWAED